MNATKTNDVAELTKLGLSTFLNIAQIAKYRYLYTLGNDLQIDSPIHIKDNELSQNRSKMIYHTCLAGLGIVGLLALGISSLNKSYEV